MEENRLELIEDMLKKSPKDSFLNYAAALEYRKNGDDEKALHLMEKLLDRDPEYLGAYYQLGKLYEERNETEKAITTYRAGKEIAKKQNDQKTIGELTEALMFLDEDADNY
tara:strand:- start:193 stop:525 length:333 start_codon:yes stop_codon:yes gene_type:complete